MKNSWKKPKAITKIACEKCFEEWKGRWHVCMALNEASFERGQITIVE